MAVLLRMLLHFYLQLDRALAHLLELLHVVSRPLILPFLLEGLGKLRDKGESKGLDLIHVLGLVLDFQVEIVGKAERIIV
jgi:hypothetical protein